METEKALASRGATIALRAVAGRVGNRGVPQASLRARRLPPHLPPLRSVQTGPLRRHLALRYVCGGPESVGTKGVAALCFRPVASGSGRNERLSLFFFCVNNKYQA